jgi:hypothetical protein
LRRMALCANQPAWCSVGDSGGSSALKSNRFSSANGFLVLPRL